MPPNNLPQTHTKMLQPSPLRSHPVRTVVFVFLVIIGVILVLILTLGSRDHEIVPPGLDVKLEAYYGLHGTYPSSLADLPGVSKLAVSKGTSLVYRTTSKDGKVYDSYDASPVTAPTGTVMCGYVYFAQTTDSVSLDPQVKSEQSVTHC